MTRTPAQAIADIKAQSAHGLPFKSGMCKQRTRLAYGVPSDGSVDAAQAWARTKHKHPASTVADAPRGALIWWTGGSQGHGHVGIKAANAAVWSVDIKRPGHWDKVPIEQISRSWPNLRLVGWSEDIDGVRVVKAGPMTRGKQIDAALARMHKAHANAVKKGKKMRAAKIQRGIDALESITPHRKGI